MSFDFIKAHAYGNDFLFISEDVVGVGEAAAVALAACDRHRGIGADGLIFYRRTAAGAAMTLFNADGSPAEVSGNGVRCLAAVVAGMPVADRTGDPFDEIVIETGDGIKTLTLIEDAHPRYVFRAFMGEPKHLRELELDAAGERIAAVVLSVGNPQCVVLTSALDEARFRRLGPQLATHPAFPNGTNVEFVEVERPSRVRILIWERGVGPTSASGTGACASAVAAAVYGGAERSIDVVSPGGSQRVDWADDGIYLTGWAELTASGQWTYVPLAD